eukprot:scaffold1678_cov110-Isochrysis_galbana.AAC.12
MRVCGVWQGGCSRRSVPAASCQLATGDWEASTSHPSPLHFPLPPRPPRTVASYNGVYNTWEKSTSPCARRDVVLYNVLRCAPVRG